MGKSQLGCDASWVVMGKTPKLDPPGQCCLSKNSSCQLGTKMRTDDFFFLATLIIAPSPLPLPKYIKCKFTETITSHISRSSLKYFQILVPLTVWLMLP